ncbi:MAG: sensor histidine kinase [Clostridium sp.]
MKNSKFGKVIISLIAVMIIMITSIGIIATYPTIDKIAKEKEAQYNYFDDYEFMRVIEAFEYKAFYENLIKAEDSNATPYEALATGTNNPDEVEEDNFNRRVNLLTEDYLNIEYFSIDTKSKITNTNIESEIKVLENGDIDTNSIREDYYQYYVVVNYDDYGKVKVKNIYGANEYELEQYLNNHNSKYLFEYTFDLKPINNTNYFLGVPKELKYVDRIYWDILKESLSNSYGEAALIFIAIGIGFVVLAGLLIPYRKAKEIIGFNIVSKTPLEIIGIITGLNIFLTVAAAMYMISECVAGVPGRFIGGIIGEITLKPGIYYLVNFIVWIVIFTVYFNVGLMLKHIFKTGLKKYFFGRVLGFVGRYIKRTIRALAEVDLTKKNNKAILKVILINGVIVSLFCFAWFFGIIGVVIYSVAVFLLINKYTDEISNKYKMLSDATKMIAEGNLDVKIEEDLGIFEPLKDDLERIQSGFKKAVDEEVKSQKMKTELISNVSHDLKTPLTAIITYVDLLKDVNLEEEKRAQYLDTLDRKAQRLQFLIEDLFEVSKATSGNITLNIEAVDVVALMKQTLLELEDKLQSSSLILRKNFPEEKVILQLDSLRTFRVFENLISNITKYAMANTRVYIDIIDKEEFVEITLKNMAAEEINFNVENIVERFVRGDESRNTEGSGLGLAIAKSFVELQGGSLNIEVDGDLFKVIINFKK